MPSLNQSAIPDLKKEAKHVPAGFLDGPGLCLLPTFYMPETEDLRWATHNNIRKTMFFHVFRSVKFCEFKRLKNETDSFELRSVTEGAEGWIDKLVETHWSKEKETGVLKQTSIWTMQRSDGTSADYKVKVYHMDDDEFRPKCYPQSPIDAFRYLWFNRTFFRIL